MITNGLDMPMKMNSRKSEFLMVTVVLAWGSSYLLMKVGLDGIGPFNLIALRFGIAFSCMFAIFLPHFRKITVYVLGKGILMGILLFCLFTGLVFGVKHTTASTAGFLASTTVIIVPIIESILKRRLPQKSVMVSILLAMVGLFLLTIKDSLSLDIGAIYCLLAALFYAIYIVRMDRLSKKTDTFLISIIQLGVVAFLGFIFMLFFETPTLPQTPMQWGAMLGLGIICSAYGLMMQSIAQRYIPSVKIGLIFSLEPVFSAILSFVFLHELLDIKGYIGATLIFLGVIFSQIKIQWPAHLKHVVKSN